MRTTLALIVLLSCSLAAAFAADKPAEPATSVTGEIADPICYLSHAALGAKHAKCAAACIKNGAPPILVTAAGEVYLLMPTHESSKAYNSVKAMAAKTVTITGQTVKRAGMMGLTVKEVKVASAGGDHPETPATKEDKK